MSKNAIEAARKRDRREENRPWAQRVKVLWYWLLTGHLVDHAKLEWHHLFGATRRTYRIPKLYSCSRDRIRREMRLCIPLLQGQHMLVHRAGPQVLSQATIRIGTAKAAGMIFRISISSLPLAVGSKDLRTASAERTRVVLRSDDGKYVGRDGRETILVDGRERAVVWDWEVDRVESQLAEMGRRSGVSWTPESASPLSDQWPENGCA